MTTITITHSFAEGTLIEGMVRGDGTYDIVTANGFRWFRTLDTCGVAQSRDHMAKQWIVNAAATALRAAGHDVEIEIDNDPRPMAEREADRAERMEDRADRMDNRAQRRAAESDAARATADHLAEAMQGEPIKIGHHSEGRHRRDLDRVHTLTHKAIDLGKEAQHAAHLAQSAATHMQHREDPMMVARRLERLAADRGRTQRALDGHTRNFRNGRGEIYTTDVTPPATGEHRERLVLIAADEDEQIAYWRAVLEQAQADGRYNPIDVAAIKTGDAVKARGRWERVAKVNKTTITVVTAPGWNNKVKILDITEHRPATAEAEGE
jgi:hypothetical protein